MKTINIPEDEPKRGLKYFVPNPWIAVALFIAYNALVVTCALGLAYLFAKYIG